MRLRSLRKDSGDYKNLNWARSQHVGMCYSNEYYQPMPLFFTREGNTLQLVGNWRGASCFLVAGGPTLGQIEAQKIKNSGIMSLGINNAVKVLRPNLWVCVDEVTHFIASVWLDPTIMKFVPFDHQNKCLWDTRDGKWEPLMVDGNQICVGDCPNMVYYRRNEKFHAARFLFEDTFNWGDCEKFGGNRSVMLPALRVLFLLGFRRVFMVGTDFKMDAEYKYAFEQERSGGSIEGNNSSYAKLQKRFKEVKKHFDKEGFEVFNCSEASELKVFPHMDFDEAIARAGSEFANLEKESTNNMYDTTYEEKQERMVRDMVKAQGGANQEEGTKDK